MQRKPQAVKADHGEGIAALLLPRELDGAFVAAEQARDLLEADRVHAVTPGRVPWGSLGRLPAPLARALAWIGARTIRLPGTPRVIVVWHPWQYPLARALRRLHPGAELWFCVWDRFQAKYAEPYDDKRRRGERLSRLYDATADDASLVAVLSTKLVELEREAGRNAALVPHGVDALPAPDPAGHVIAVSLGYLTPRVDWKLLRTLGERMQDLTVLMVGSGEEGCANDPDFQACRRLPNFVWLGHRVGEEAARLIMCADVGLVPLRVEPYNDGAAPHRILKYARLGRRSIAPDLAGSSTYEPAVVRATTPEEWEQALRAHAGARGGVDSELREWALQQSTRAYNKPLWDRLEELGISMNGR